MIDSVSGPASGYQPGVCNIGPQEIARRRRSAIAATAIAVAVAVVILAVGAPSVARLALLPFVAAGAVSWLQVTRRFCVGFGAAGILNFGDLGTTLSVDDAEARAADRRTARRMILEGLLYGALVTICFWLLPL